MNFPLGHFRDLTIEEKEAIARLRRDQERKSTISSVAMNILVATKMMSGEYESPRAAARRAFEVAEAYWDELEARGHSIGGES